MVKWKVMDINKRNLCKTCVYCSHATLKHAINCVYGYKDKICFGYDTGNVKMCNGYKEKKNETKENRS